MHRRAILAIARKDALDIILNRSTLVLLMTPIFLSLLFLLIGNVLGTKSTDLLIYNPSNSSLEQLLGSSFDKAHIIHADSATQVDNAFGLDGTHKKVSYTLGAVIPADFEATLKAGGHPAIRFYINEDNTNAQEPALIGSLIANYTRRVASPQDPATVTSAVLNPPQASNPLQDVKTIYALAAVMGSFMVGISLVPGMLVEEKEKKTLRMLLVTPASLFDIVLGKLAVGFGYQILLAVAALFITGGFVGQVPLLLFFVLLGTCFAMSLGLLAGSIFQTTSATGAFGGIVGFIFIVPVFFVSPFLTGDGLATQVMKLLPTYYIAEGIFNALTNVANQTILALDIGVVVASTAILFGASVFALRRQTAVIATV